MYRRYWDGEAPATGLTLRRGFYQYCDFSDATLPAGEECLALTTAAKLGIIARGTGRRRLLDPLGLP